MLCLAATESPTSLECYRSRAKCRKGLVWYKQDGFLSGEHGDWRMMDVLDPLKQVLEGSVQSTTCTVPKASNFPFFASMTFTVQKLVVS